MGRAGRAPRPRGAQPQRGRRPALNRGAIYDVELPGGRRPVVIVTRDRAIPILANVTVAAVTGDTSRTADGRFRLVKRTVLRASASLNCDNLFTIPKSSLATRRGELDPEALERLGAALKIALDLD